MRIATFRTVGVTHHRVLWSPDFPLPDTPPILASAGSRAATVRPTCRLMSIIAGPAERRSGSELRPPLQVPLVSVARMGIPILVRGRFFRRISFDPESNECYDECFRVYTKTPRNRFARLSVFYVPSTEFTRLRAGGQCVAIVQVKDLIEAGVHFGHRASRWNPKMRPYIYGKRNLIHIIDLRETVRGLLRAYRYLSQLASKGSLVLFVGTKRQ